MKPTTPPLLSVDDVAERSNVCTKTVRRWIERGELNVHRFGRALRVSEDDLSAFLNKNRR